VDELFTTSRYNTRQLEPVDRPPSGNRLGVEVQQYQQRTLPLQGPGYGHGQGQGTPRTTMKPGQRAGSPGIRDHAAQQRFLRDIQRSPSR